MRSIRHWMVAVRILTLRSNHYFLHFVELSPWHGVQTGVGVPRLGRVWQVRLKPFTASFVQTLEQTAGRETEWEFHFV